MADPTISIKCLVVDDELYARQLLVHHIGKVNFLELVGECKNAFEAQTLLKRTDVDLIFLDVQMPHKTGIKFLEETKPTAKVILTTAYQNYALKGFELEVADYLLKPVLEERFMRCIDRVKKDLLISAKAQHFDSLLEAKENSIVIKTGYDTHKILLSSIDYIESVGEYIRFHVGSKKYLVLNSLTNMVGQLPEDFIRTHRSYIIPKEKIVSKQGHSFVLKNGVTIPIGKTYRSKFSQFQLNR